MSLSAAEAGNYKYGTILANINTLHLYVRHADCMK